ncbi:MAG: acyltransferase [Proteobacteria bacterium]|nr:acyltransferase [Pseudomonadota bacterium]
MKLSTVNKERLGYIHAMRGIAILIVVAAHCQDIFPSNSIIHDHYFQNLFRHINLIFIFISGFLFQYLSGNFKFSVFIKKKLQYVIIPYIIISIPAMLIYLFEIKQNHIFLDLHSFSDSKLYLSCYFLLTGTHLGPLWFIPMMFIFYLISPILCKLDRLPKLYLTIIPLLFISLYIGRSEHSANPIQNFVFYLPVFLLGMLCSHYKDKIIPIIKSNLVIINLVWVLGVFSPEDMIALDSIIFLTKIFFCAGIIGVLSKYEELISSKNINKLANASFGIFFVHGYFVGATRMLMPNSSLSAPIEILIYITYLTTVIFLSVISVWIVQKITGKNSRLIIGS